MRISGPLMLVLALAGLHTAAPASTIELHAIQSDTLGREMRYNILLPDGYRTSTERYPVLYLFRGHEREWVNPTEDASRRGTIQTVYDALYAAGSVGKMIIVMPGLSAPSSGPEFAAVLTELIPHIDATYRTIPIRTRRGLDGFSYGGYDMLELLWRRPAEFITAGAYDGSFWAFELDTLAAAPASFWDQLRPIRFLIHSAGPGIANHGVSELLLSILAGHGIANTFDTLALAPLAPHNWFHADLHMERALPLHWASLTGDTLALPLSVLSPAPGSTVAGAVAVSWSVAERPAAVRVEYSADGGATWAAILDTTTSDTTTAWNTAGLEDGTRYRLRVRASTASRYGYAESAGTFTVDNPGNGAPDVVLLSPLPGSLLTGDVSVEWAAADPEGDAVTITVETSADSGITWSPAGSTGNSGSYLLDTRQVANTPDGRLRLTASDGQASRQAVSDIMTVANARPSLADTLVGHVAGIADGSVTVRVVDPGNLTGHRYRVRFQQNPKQFSVDDLALGGTVLGPLPLPGAGRETEAFDGMRLVFTDHDPPVVSADSTRWTTGSSTFAHSVLIPTFDPGTGPITGVPYLADYILTLHDQAADTSSPLYGWIPTPVNVTVWNTTEDHQVEFLFADLDGDQRLGRFDVIVILESDTAGDPLVTWQLGFTGDPGAVPPAPGDVFRLKILKPFAATDVYEFTADPGGVVAVAPEEIPGAFALDQNFPNPFNPSTTISYAVPERGQVRLEVFDLLGRRVALLVDGVQEGGRHSVRFRADGLASGLYIYRLEAAGAAAVRKMLLVR